MALALRSSVSVKPGAQVCSCRWRKGSGRCGPGLTCSAVWWAVWWCCRSAIVRETLLGAINTKLIEAGSEIVSIYHRR